MRIVLALAAALPLAAQAPTDIEFRVQLKGGQVEFHQGEAIPIELTFSSTSRDKYALDMRQYDRIGRMHFTDEFLVEPAEGTSDPLQDYFPSAMGLGGIGGVAVLGPKPAVLTRELNEWVRFDKPGQYRIRVRSRRVTPKAISGRPPARHFELFSNTVEIAIVPADSAWQARELRRAIEVLETVLPGSDSKTLELRQSAARRIRFLNTPGSVQQCVRWFRGVDVQLDEEFRFCLLGTTQRRLAVETMERALRDPGQPVSTSFVETLAKIKSWLEAGAPGAYPKEKPAQEEWRARQEGTYEHEMKLLAGLTEQLVAVVGPKDGAAKAVSIRTLAGLLTRAKQELPAELKGDLAASFADLPEMQQLQVLAAEWDTVKTAAMLPVLRRIVGDPPEGRRELGDLAVRRIYDLDPAEGRRLILEDIERPEPRFGFEVLSMLPERTLPSAESAILRNVERTRSWIGRELIARYASKAIVPRVKTLYEAIDKEMRARKMEPGDVTSSPVRSIAAPACEPALIAYFLRVEPSYGEAKLRQALSERWSQISTCYNMILPQTARHYAGPEWEKIAIEALRDPVVEVKMYAAKALGERGSAAAKKPLFDTFDYWHNWWKDRPHEINAQNQSFERELLLALAAGKHWKLEKADFSRLESLCLTQQCKSQARSCAPQAAR